MRIFRLAALLLTLSFALPAQLDHYVEKLWEKWASERMAHNLAEKNFAEKLEFRPLPREPAKPEPPEPKATPIDPRDVKKDQELTQDIAECTLQTYIVDPYKSAVKSALGAARDKFGERGSTLEVVYQAADLAFEQRLFTERADFTDHPENAIASEAKCIIGKRIKDPIARAMAKCAADKLIRDKNCFESYLNN
jgi:hypothetical protein